MVPLARSGRGEEEVAPTCSRLYRGFVIREPWPVPRSLALPRAADCKSAIRQVTNLRYFMSDGAFRFGYKIFFGRKFPKLKK